MGVSTAVVRKRFESIARGSNISGSKHAVTRVHAFCQCAPNAGTDRVLMCFAFCDRQHRRMFTFLAQHVLIQTFMPLLRSAGSLQNHSTRLCFWQSCSDACYHAHNKHYIVHDPDPITRVELLGTLLPTLSLLCQRPVGTNTSCQHVWQNTDVVLLVWKLQAARARRRDLTVDHVDVTCT